MKGEQLTLDFSAGKSADAQDIVYVMVALNIPYKDFGIVEGFISSQLSVFTKEYIAKNLYSMYSESFGYFFTIRPKYFNHL